MRDRVLLRSVCLYMIVVDLDGSHSQYTLGWVGMIDTLFGIIHHAT